jgi:hypothetical protein
MITYRQISRCRKYVKVNDHAVEKYHIRFCRDCPPDRVRWKLKNAYLRGEPLSVGELTRVARFFKHKSFASYYKYGDIIVVVRETGQRYDECPKTIVTCYQFKDSQFDPEDL